MKVCILVKIVHFYNDRFQMYYFYINKKITGITAVQFLHTFIKRITVINKTFFYKIITGIRTVQF